MTLYQMGHHDLATECTKGVRECGRDLRDTGERREKRNIHHVGSVDYVQVISMKNANYPPPPPSPGDYTIQTFT